MSLDLVLRRERSMLGATLGELTVQGARICWTLEDTVRPAGQKVPGQTAIPQGSYPVRISYSPRFHREMPEVLSVPGFEGIRIHWGNFASDTEGCILVGLTRMSENSIGESLHAYDRVEALIRQAVSIGQDVVIHVTDPSD